jgi:hypothetical protein
MLHLGRGTSPAPGVNRSRASAGPGDREIGRLRASVDHLTARRGSCYVQRVPIAWMSRSRGLSLLLLLGVGCGGLRASRVPLGGAHEPEAQTARPSPSAAAAAEAAPAPAAPVALPGEGEDSAEVSEVVVSAEPAASPTPAPAAPGTFQARPFTAGQTWTRSFDLELSVKIGPGGSIDMRMLSHQEARFEILAASAGVVERLAIDYLVYKSSLSVMGSTQESPEELDGKRYVVTFPGGKPDVKNAAGGTPSKRELETIEDDAREPLVSATALKELTSLAAQGSGNFSLGGAVALAGGEDDDTKVTRAKASLQRLGQGPGGEKSAIIDLSYTLTSTPDDGASIEAQLSGTLLALATPARYHTVTLAGPVELRAPDAGGMAGRGTTNLSVTYKY